MAMKQISVQRLSMISSKSFGDVVARLEAAVGRPDMNVLWRNISAAKTFADLEEVIHKVIGPSGFLEVARFDHGMVLGKEYGEQTPKRLRFLIGNPLIMKQMVEQVPDAGSYAPVTVLIDERPDGVHQRPGPRRAARGPAPGGLPGQRGRGLRHGKIRRLIFLAIRGHQASPNGRERQLLLLVAWHRPGGEVISNHFLPATIGIQRGSCLIETYIHVEALLAAIVPPGKHAHLQGLATFTARHPVQKPSRA